MSLNIEDPEAHRLAQAIADVSLDELMAVAKRASFAVKRPYIDHGELLYDEHGLPRRSPSLAGESAPANPALREPWLRVSQATLAAPVTERG